jgi:hypothetical protein
VHTSFHGAGLRDVPALLDPLELELGDHGQDPYREATHRRRAIEAVLDRDETRPCCIQASNRIERIDRRAGEAIELGNDDPARLTTLTARERLLEHGTLELGARLVDLFPPLNDLNVVRLSPLGDLLALNVRGDEGFALATSAPADPDVAVSDPCFHVRIMVFQLDVVKYLDDYRIELIEHR